MREQASYDADADRTRVVVGRAERCDPLGPTSFDAQVEGRLFDLSFPRGSQGGPSIVVASSLAQGTTTPSSVHVAVYPFGASAPLWSEDVPLAAVTQMQHEVGTGDAYRAFVLATDPPTRVSVHDGSVVVD